MHQREAERHYPLPGMVAEFSPHFGGRNEAATMTKVISRRVRDVSVLDCAFEADSTSRLRQGDHGMLFMSMGDRAPTLVRDARVARVWDGGVAVRFDSPYCVDRYFGDPSPDAYAAKRKQAQNTQKAMVESVRLTAEIGQLRTRLCHVFLAGLTAATLLMVFTVFSRGSGEGALV